MRLDKTSYIEKVLKSENKACMYILFKLWRYVFESATIMCILFMGMCVLLTVIRLCLSFLWGKYIDIAYRDGASKLFSLIVIACIYCLLNLIQDILDRYLYRQETIERLDIVQANRFQEFLNMRIFQEIGKKRSELLEVPRINDLIARVWGFIEDGVNGLNRGIMVSSAFLLTKVISTLIIAYSLYSLNPWLCVVFIIVPVPVLYTTYIGDRAQFRFRKTSAELKRKTDYYQDLMTKTAVKEMKVMSSFSFFMEKWKMSVNEYTQKENRNNLFAILTGSINSTLTISVSILANIVAIVLMTRGDLTLGELSTAMVLNGTLINDVGVLFKSAATLMSKKNDAAMFFDLIDLPCEKDGGDTIEKIEMMRFQDVSYRYPTTDRYVLKDINLSIKAGEKIALVGENGAGKSTFIKLICGILNPSQGEIIINDKYKDFNGQKLFNYISTVSQVPIKYKTFTIYDNIFLGESNKERRDDLIEDAFTFAGLDSLDGSSMLGKEIGGIDLSGGEWQKLAIARGYYRNRNLMILDEPTGNLDPFAESDILSKYLMMSSGKTVIIVTHRISAASLADRIIVFEKGQIVEDGSHDELLKMNGLYARLYNAQATWYE